MRNAGCKAALHPQPQAGRGQLLAREVTLWLPSCLEQPAGPRARMSHPNHPWEGARLSAELVLPAEPPERGTEPEPGGLGTEQQSQPGS